MGKVCVVMSPQSGRGLAGLNDLADCYFVNRIGNLLTRGIDPTISVYEEQTKEIEIYCYETAN